MKNNWVGTKEISIIAGCGLNTALQIKKEVNAIIEEKGYRVVSAKKTSRKELLKYLGLEETE